VWPTSQPSWGRSVTTRRAQAITGRAGLRPSHYQSGKVDRKGGPLLRCGNRALRAALLRAADCLMTSNPYFGPLARTWEEAGDDARHIRIKVAQRLARILYQLVAGNQVFCHPNYDGRHYILKKVLEFHLGQGTPAATLVADLEAAVPQLPATERPAEAEPVQDYLESLQNGGHRDRLGLAALLPKVLALLGAERVQSRESGAASPHGPKRANGPRTPSVPMGQTPRKEWRSLGSPNA